MTRPRTATAVVLLCLASISAKGQPQTTVWDTHDELVQWISLPPGVVSGDGLLLQSDGSRQFVRIQWRELLLKVRPALPNFMFPGYEVHRWNFSQMGQLPPLTDPVVHNALKLTMRQAMGMDTVTGRWIHQDWNIDSGIETTPAFEEYGFPSDGQWHETVLRFTDSPYYEDDKPITFVTFAVGQAQQTAEQIEARYAALPQSAYLDIDRIEFAHVEETVPEPTITRIVPIRGPLETEVTIEGSNFGVPASRNLVYFGGEEGGPAQVISGTSTVLRVRSYSHVGSSYHITVRTPGGRRAVSAESFLVLGSPAKVLIVTGGGQTGGVGTKLGPMSVKVVDDNQNGLSGLKVGFRVASGAGSLSDGEVTTDDNGLASTVLTLPTEPGVVKVEAKVYGFSPVVFTATALP